MSSCLLMFPGVRRCLVFLGFGLKPPASGFQSYFYSSPKTSPSPFEDNGLLFWVPDVLCRHSEVVLWNLLSVQMFFWWICGGESGLPILFLCHLSSHLSLLFNMLSKLIIAFLPRSKCLLISLLQSSSAVILEPKKIKSVTVSIVSPSISHEVMGPDAMIFIR